nr:hypothetical protein CFP56_02765 [Quercus suber]
MTSGQVFGGKASIGDCSLHFRSHSSKVGLRIHPNASLNVTLCIRRHSHAAQCHAIEIIMNGSRSVLCHTIRLLDLRDLLRPGTPVGQDLHLELRHDDPEQLQQRRLVTVHLLALFTYHVLLTQHHFALLQLGRHSPLPHRDLERMRQRHIVLDRLLAARGVHHAGWHRDRPRRAHPGSREIHLRVAGEVLEHDAGVAVGEEQADAAGEEPVQLAEARRVFILGRGAEGLGHDLGLAEEQPAVGGELLAHVFEVGVAHVVDGEDEDVLVGVGGRVDRGVQRRGLFLARLFLHHRRVDDLGTFGFGHGGGRSIVREVGGAGDWSKAELRPGTASANLAAPDFGREIRRGIEPLRDATKLDMRSSSEWATRWPIHHQAES